MRASLCMSVFLALVVTVAAGAQDLSTAQAASHVAEQATVCGVVTGIHYAARSHGAPTFLDFDRPYPNQPFTVVIWGADRSNFGNLRQYADRQVCALGAISLYRGKPEIIVHTSDSLTAK
jgi:hypothetical protein